MLELYYSALLVILAFLFLTFILLPMLASLIFYSAYALLSLFRRFQNRSLHW